MNFQSKATHFILLFMTAPISDRWNLCQGVMYSGITCIVKLEDCDEINARDHSWQFACFSL